MLACFYTLYSQIYKTISSNPNTGCLLFRSIHGNPGQLKSGFGLSVRPISTNPVLINTLLHFCVLNLPTYCLE